MSRKSCRVRSASGICGLRDWVSGRRGGYGSDVRGTDETHQADARHGRPDYRPVIGRCPADGVPGCPRGGPTSRPGNRPVWGVRQGRGASRPGVASIARRMTADRGQGWARAWLRCLFTRRQRIERVARRSGLPELAPAGEVRARCAVMAVLARPAPADATVSPSGRSVRRTCGARIANRSGSTRWTKCPSPAHPSIWTSGRRPSRSRSPSVVGPAGRSRLPACGATAMLVPTSTIQPTARRSR
jgi:hypothetical protein